MHMCVYVILELHKAVIKQPGKRTKFFVALVLKLLSFLVC